MTRLAVLLTIIGAAVSAPRFHHEATPAPLTGATHTPRTSASPVHPKARATPTRASRTRRATADPLSGSGSHLNWPALRQCESSGNYHDRDSLTYRGAYQFDRTTWQSVGGHGDPADATPTEQDLRARRLYNLRGRQPWPVCGRQL